MLSHKTSTGSFNFKAALIDPWAQKNENKLTDILTLY